MSSYKLEVISFLILAINLWSLVTKGARKLSFLNDVTGPIFFFYLPAIILLCSLYLLIFKKYSSLRFLLIFLINITSIIIGYKFYMMFGLMSKIVNS